MRTKISIDVLRAIRDEVLPPCRTMAEAEEAIASRFGWRIPYRTMFSAFQSEFGSTPGAFLRSAHKPSLHIRQDRDIEQLVEAVKDKGEKTLEAVCNQLKRCPADVKEIVERAVKEGYSLRVRGSLLSFEDLQAPTEPVQLDAIPPAKEYIRFGMISDTHIGSKYCRVAELQDFIHTIYRDYGVRDIFHAGDVLDGHHCYRGQEMDLSDVGFEAQAAAAIRVLPALPGLRYSFITGNHDTTFHKLSGVNPGAALVSRFREAGRGDLVYLGPDHAVVHVGPDVNGGKYISVELHHPDGGTAYAVSYRLQKTVSEIKSGTKPDILVQGHFHRYVQFEDRNIFAAHPGCFQGQTPFLRRKYISPALGGMVIDVGLTEDFRVRKIRGTWFPYSASYIPQRKVDPAEIPFTEPPT